MTPARVIPAYHGLPHGTSERDNSGAGIEMLGQIYVIRSRGFEWRRVALVGLKS